MADETLGRNPLGGELDSIWKIPKPKAKPAEKKDAETLQADAAPQPASPPVRDEAEDTGVWEPLEEAEPSETGEEVTGVDAYFDDSAEKAKEFQEESIQLVGFKLGDEIYGIEIVTIQEIIRLQEITRVPKTREFVQGVVNLRGKVIPIISLRGKFGFAEADEDTKDSRIIIVNSKFGGVGLRVDAVAEVFRINKSLIVPAPPSSAHLDSEYIDGVGRLEEKLLTIINIDKLFAEKEAIPRD